MAPDLSSELSAFRISARDGDLAFLQGLLEASEGLGVIHGVRGGEVVLVTPRSREGAVRELLADLKEERGVHAEFVDATEHVPASLSRSASEGAVRVAD